MSRTDPAYKAIPIDVSGGDQVFSTPCRAIYVGGAGNLVIRMPNDAGTNITFTGLLAGMIYPIQAKEIEATGTTATDMVALF